MTGLAIALAVFTLAGGRGPWGERFLRGLAVAGIAMFCGALVHVPLTLTLAIVVLCGAAMTRRPPRIARIREPLPTALMLVPVVFVFIASLRYPLADFDGRVFWLLKAKAIAHEQAVDGPFFRGEVMWSPRNRYPLLMPLDAGIVLHLANTLDDRQVRGLYALMFLALLLVIRRRAGAWQAAIVAWIPRFLVHVEGGALTAYNDIPMAAFAACAMFDIAEAAPPLRIGIWLAALTLTKSEGIVYAAVLLAAAAVVHRRRVWPAAALYAVAASALVVWRMRVPHTDEEDFLARLPLLPHTFGRALPAIEGVARHMVTVASWGFFWIAVVLFAIWQVAQALLPAGRATGRSACPTFVIGAMLCVYVAVYMVTAWPLAELVNSSADRLLMQLAGPAVLLLSAPARSR
jgi:hypothetical protein